MLLIVKLSANFFETKIFFLPDTIALSKISPILLSWIIWTESFIINLSEGASNSPPPLSLPHPVKTNTETKTKKTYL